MSKVRLYQSGNKLKLYCHDLFLCDPPIPYLKWNEDSILSSLKNIFGDLNIIFQEDKCLGNYWYKNV